MLLVSRDFVGNRSRVDRCDLLKNRLSLKFVKEIIFLRMDFKWMLNINFCLCFAIKESWYFERYVETTR